MAEAAVIGIVQNILGALASEALKKVWSFPGIKDEVESFRGKVLTIQKFLSSAEEKSENEPAVADWVQRLKDAFLDAEDLLDEISTAALRREQRSNPVSKFFSSTSLEPIFRMKFAPRIKEAKDKIDELEKECISLHMEQRDVMYTRGMIGVRRRESTHSYICDEEIIGRDDSKREIIELLLDVNVAKVSVIPVVGIGGLGKTAIAQYVFNDERIREHFEQKIWVCVSHVFDVKSVAEKIIGSDMTIKMEMEQLQTIVRRKLEGKRYLLVLDDFWSEDRQKWLDLESLLMCGARESKILITTRLDSVANSPRTARQLYKLGSLSEEMSWDLFTRMAFREGEGSRDPEFVSIGKDILKKCKGVPLAIRSLGSLLLTKEKIEEWLYIRDQELSNINQQEDDIIPILKLSYDHLPPVLKQCFAYCSLFPKDCQIDKDDLIRLWMAQGFIQSGDMGRDLEDIGEDCFMDLFRRNLFQELRLTEEDPWRYRESCKMHDLMHDLARKVAGNECTSFSHDANGISERTRHVSCSSIMELPELLRTFSSKGKKLRTFLLEDPVGVSAALISENNVWRLTRLRVLCLKGAGMKTVPSCIKKLEHLRELDLSGNPIKKLPRSIVKLQNLLTLKLRDCTELEELPRDLRKLVNLRNLDIHGCETLRLSHMPSGVGELTSLHTLSMFVLPHACSRQKHHARLDELGGLDNLRGALEIWGLGFTQEAVTECIGAKLVKKGGLRSLSLFWGCPAGDPAAIKNHEAILEGLQPHRNLQRLSVLGYGGMRFPRWMVEDMNRCIPNLVEIYLGGCAYIRHLPPLGQLPHLKVMSVVHLDMLGCIENMSSSGVSPNNDRTSDMIQPQFPCLSKLFIDHCPKLTALPPSLTQLEQLSLGSVNEGILQGAVGQLHGLKILSIKDMDTLEKVPEEWLRGLTSLESMIIMDCPKLTSLSRGLQYLTKLNQLQIKGCEVLDLSVDENGDALQLHGLVELHLLHIRKTSKLKSLPEWLHHLTSLRLLSLEELSNLVAIPGWIGELRSLGGLLIYDCPNLTTLPDEISQLRSLVYLFIGKCPRLEEACNEETGTDRHKIAHVQHVAVGYPGWDQWHRLGHQS